MAKSRRKKPTTLPGREGRRRPARSYTSSLLGEEDWRLIADSLDLVGRQLQMVQCVLDGLDEPGIARILRISVHTVHAHMNRLYRKIGVHRRADLVLRVFLAYLSRYSEANSEGSEAMNGAKSVALMRTERGHMARAARAAM